MFVRKMKKGDAHKYLCDQIKYVGESKPYMQRNAEEFSIRKVQSTQVQKTLFYKILKLYNFLPTNIKNELNKTITINYVLFNDL